MLQSLLLVAAPILLIAYLLKELHYRRFKQYAVLPQLKPSLVWGHMKVLHEVSLRGPPGQHFDQTASEIHEELGRPPVFILDLRPVTYPLLVIANHEVAEQVSRVSTLFPWSTTKSPTIKEHEPLLGTDSLFLVDGEEWKGLRKRRGSFMKHLDSYARTGEDFPLGDLLTNLTFDIIGLVSADVDFGAQRDKAHQSKFIQAYQQLIRAFQQSENPLPNPRATVRRWLLARRVDSLLIPVVQQKLIEYSQAKSGTKARSIVALAVQDADPRAPGTLEMAVSQIKGFLFAGHDTTSILLQWAFYELSRNPRALKAICSELDEIFGTDPEPSIIRDKLLADADDVMRRMTYTSAVIKETLRLYPPAATTRMSKPGTHFRLRNPVDGREIPIDVDGVILYNCATITQRDPAVYGDTAEEFDPDRWLGNTDTSMKTNEDMAAGEKGGSGVPASAWRPFERGPRNCIGQELANIEARVILALAVRRYDFYKVGPGEIALDQHGNPRLNAKGEYEVKSKIYNTRNVTARPVDRMMMKVKLSPKASLQI